MEILTSHKGTRVDGERTICEVHRTIADLLVCRLSDRPDVLEEILPQLDQAYRMGIRLVLALVERKIALPKWAANNVAEAAMLRKERNRLVKELYATGHYI